MDYSKLINVSYWFSPTPSGEINNLKIWIILFSAMVVFGAINLINKFMNRRLRNRIASLFLTTGLIGITFLFFRFEGVYFLSSRFWFLTLLIVFIVWLTKLFIYLAKDYPKEMKSLSDYKKFTAYLPKKKTK